MMPRLLTPASWQKERPHISPISDKKEHGIGTRSMVHYVEKLHGQCNFSVQEHKFLLRIIL